MHTYASQTAEARELVSELEFVWDQVKSNMSSSTAASSPVQSTGFSPIPQPQSSYGSIGAQLAQHPEYQYLASTARGDSRLRVLSPVSQPDEIYQRRAARKNYDREQGSDQTVDDEDDVDLDEDEDEEEYAEAQANLYEDDEDEDEVSGVIEDDDDDEHGYTNHDPDGNRSRKRIRNRNHNGNDHHIPDPDPDPSTEEGNVLYQGGMLMHQSKDDVDSRRWRRRVEQALTKMTAEIAAAREQVEARALSARRRSGVWAWLRWLVWVTLRQIIWDLAVLGMLLIWMRLRRDPRLEEQLKAGWSVVKTRLQGLKALKGMRKVYIPFP